MINKRINTFAKIVKNVIFLVGLLFFILTNIQCDLINPPNNKLGTKNQMIVYRNLGSELYIIDINNYKIFNKIILPVPDSIQVHGIIPSTNRDYLIGCGALDVPPFTNFIFSYNMSDNSIHTMFSTDLDSVGAPRMIAAQKQEEPGLFYLYSHNIGLYKINFLTKSSEIISEEKYIPKNFFLSNKNGNGDNWIVIKKYFPGYEQDYTELQFYLIESDLKNMQFVLNENDEDGVDVIDMTFSDDNNCLYISYLLSQRRGVYDSAFFSSYNLSTKEFSNTNVKLPWSKNPYYISYSSKRKECYLVGQQDAFYIIDISSNNYKIKSIIKLSNKIDGPSKILIHPNEDIAFISCYDSNLIFVIDLESKIVKNKITVEHPYQMFYLDNDR